MEAVHSTNIANAAHAAQNAQHGHAWIIHWFGLEFDLWMVIMTWVTMGILILASWLAVRKLQWIPKGWQNAMEMVVEFIEDLIRNSLGRRGLKYTYFFCSLFLFIIIANMLGLIPGLASPTKDVSITLSLAAVWLIWQQYISIRENGFGKYLKHYLEPFAPFAIIHIMDLGIRPLTMALRLYGNIFAGEILLEKLTENFKLVIPSVWLLISVVIGAIQAFIFTVLSISYTGLSVHDDHAEH